MRLWMLLISVCAILDLYAYHVKADDTTGAPPADFRTCSTTCSKSFVSAVATRRLSWQGYMCSPEGRQLAECILDDISLCGDISAIKSNLKSVGIDTATFDNFRVGGVDRICGPEQTDCDVDALLEVYECVESLKGLLPSSSLFQPALLMMAPDAEPDGHERPIPVHGDNTVETDNKDGPIAAPFPMPLPNGPERPGDNTGETENNVLPGVRPLPRPSPIFPDKEDGNTGESGNKEVPNIARPMPRPLPLPMPFPNRPDGSVEETRNNNGGVTRPLLGSSSGQNENTEETEDGGRPMPVPRSLNIQPNGPGINPKTSNNMQPRRTKRKSDEPDENDQKHEMPSKRKQILIPQRRPVIIAPEEIQEDLQSGKTKDLQDRTRDLPGRTRDLQPVSNKDLHAGRTGDLPSKTKNLPSETKELPNTTKDLPSKTKDLPSGTKGMQPDIISMINTFKPVSRRQPSPPRKILMDISTSLPVLCSQEGRSLAQCPANVMKECPSLHEKLKILQIQSTVMFLEDNDKYSQLVEMLCSSAKFTPAMASTMTCASKAMTATTFTRCYEKAAELYIHPDKGKALSCTYYKAMKTCIERHVGDRCDHKTANMLMTGTMLVLDTMAPTGCSNENVGSGSLEGLASSAETIKASVLFTLLFVVFHFILSRLKRT